MSETNPGTSGANTEAGGNGSNPSDPVDQNTGTYPAHFVDKLKKEKLSQAQKLQDLTKQLEDMKANQAATQTADLEKQAQYQKLYEQEKARNQELSGKYSGLQSQIVEGKKKAAIKEQLIKLGLNPKHESTALRLIDAGTVVVDDETGVVVGAEEAARTFHESHKDLGLFAQKVPGTSHAAPNANQKLTTDISKMNRAQLKEELKKNLEQGG